MSTTESPENKEPTPLLGLGSSAGLGHFRRVPGWDCSDGTPEEDHDWKLIVGDSSVGEGDYMECRQCGKDREATEAEIADSWHDPLDD